MPRCCRWLLMGLLELVEVVSSFFVVFFFVGVSGRCGNLKANLVRFPPLFVGPLCGFYDDNAFAVIIISQTQTMNFIIFPSIHNGRTFVGSFVKLSKLQNSASKAFKHPLFPHAPPPVEFPLEDELWIYMVDIVGIWNGESPKGEEGKNNVGRRTHSVCWK